MKIKELKTSLPYIFKANLVPCLVGQHGIGKSAIVKQTADEMGIGFIDIRLGQMADAGDLTGLPSITNGQTHFNHTSLLPREGEGILFLDELNRCTKDIMQAVFQLVLDKKLGEYTLPKGWKIVAAMNPDSDEYNVTSFDDQAFLDRFMMLRLEPSVKEFTSYMDKKGYSTVAAFLTDSSSLLEKKISFNLNVTPSRRSWESVALLEQTGLPKECQLSNFSGLVGIEAAASYIQFLEKQEVISLEDIFNNFPKVKKQVTKMTEAEVSKIIEEIDSWLESNVIEDVKVEKNVIDFLKTIPKEAAYAAIHSRFANKFNGLDLPSNKKTGFLGHPKLEKYFD